MANTLVKLPEEKRRAIIVLSKMKTKPRTIYTWSDDMAYAVGLVASDGCLQRDGRVVLTSKDRELLETFRRIVGAEVTIRSRSGGFGVITEDVWINRPGLYDFMLAVGLTPAKSKTIGPLNIPEEYLLHFVRGVLDGDGTIVILHDKRSRLPMLQTKFFSASKPFLEWLWISLRQTGIVEGGTIYTFNRPFRQLYSLMFAKSDSIRLLQALYKNPCAPHLARKKAKFEEFFALTRQVTEKQKTATNQSLQF